MTFFTVFWISFVHDDDDIASNVSVVVAADSEDVDCWPALTML
jgi:hypothetical protein